MSDTYTPTGVGITVASLLSARGVKPTQQRIDIASILLARPQHLSAEEILSAVNRQGHSVSKATVYNTLNLFVRKGLVREVNVDPARLYYDSNTSPHFHIYNVDTGELTDLDPKDIELHLGSQLPHGTELVDTEVVFRVRRR